MDPNTPSPYGAYGVVGSAAVVDPNQSKTGRRRRSKYLARDGAAPVDAATVAAGDQPIQAATPQTAAEKMREANMAKAQPNRAKLAKYDVDPSLSIAGLDAEQVNKLVRRPPPKPKGMTGIEYVPLVANKDKDGSKITHDAVKKMDKRRKALLALARNTSAINTLWKLHLMPRTVIPKIFKKPMIWALLSTFVLGAMLQRFGAFTAQQLGEAEALMDMGGLGTTVAFMTVFYTGYCYTRSQNQFDDIQTMMHAINNVCIVARTSFGDDFEIRRLWRYLNLLHAAAYCGITASATQSNFFDPLRMKYGLEGEGYNRDEEEKLIKALDIDGNGMRVCSLYLVWSFEVVQGEAVRGSIGEATQTYLQGEIAKIGVSIQRLYAYRYQVMPFVYTHLVSFACFIYLGCSGFLSGFQFGPESSWTFGLGVPAAFYAIKIFTTFGLFEVGEVILDPFGDDPEDFALLHFVESTVCASWECISVQRLLPRMAEQVEYYRAKELLAAKKIIKKLVERYRWRKMIEAARALKELEARKVQKLREQQEMAKQENVRRAVKAQNGWHQVKQHETSKNAANYWSASSTKDPRDPASAALPREDGSMKIKDERRHSRKSRDATTVLSAPAADLNA